MAKHGTRIVKETIVVQEPEKEKVLLYGPTGQPLGHSRKIGFAVPELADDDGVEWDVEEGRGFEE